MIRRYLFVRVDPHRVFLAFLCSGAASERLRPVNRLKLLVGSSCELNLSIRAMLRKIRSASLVDDICYRDSDPLVESDKVYEVSSRYSQKLHITKCTNGCVSRLIS
jgi:hypothetical protein